LIKETAARRLFFYVEKQWNNVENHLAFYLTMLYNSHIHAKFLNIIAKQKKGDSEMKKANKTIAMLLAFLMSLSFVMVSTPPAMAAGATALATTISNRTGLTATVNGAEVTVRGAPTTVAALDLNIDAGVTVIWEADYFGAINNTTATYLISLSGAGAFRVSGATISNTGTSGVIGVGINGTEPGGTTVTLENGAAILSDRSGYSLFVNVSGVTVNVNSGSTIRSLSNNSNAALQIGSSSITTVSDVRININDGGSIISDNSGYAINDGAGAGVREHNTYITVNNGVVSSGSACAINSTGRNSVVEVKGGMVQNNAASNANPTIYMNGSTGTNVIVSGGTVQNTAANTTSYTVQTTGNILVSGGEVTTKAGRAINLVGEDSVATVSGGAVRATDPAATGVAISTATTNPATVPNASVVVTGGQVTATTGSAIRVTGANSRVDVRGGTVSAVSGNAILADAGTAALNTAANFSIIVSGGSVSATTGYAIYNLGRANSKVIVSDNPNGLGGSGGRGGQVSVLSKVPAIHSQYGHVTVNGGFVFSYGLNATDAIYTPTGGVTWPTYLGGVVATWNVDAGDTYYPQSLAGHPEFADLDWRAYGARPVLWDFNPTLGSGISYGASLTAGFFPLLPVTVTVDYGLIFDSTTGRMYRDEDRTGTLSPANLAAPFLLGVFDGAWSGSPGKLTLNGFRWTTAAPTALTIIGRDTEIVLNGNSTFEATGSSVSCGIRLVNASMTITTVPGGNGALTAKGSASPTPANANVGIDLGSGDFTINGGAFVAQGARAVMFTGANGDVSPNYASGHYYWTWSKNYDGGGDPGLKGPYQQWDDGYSDDIPFEFFDSDQYVMFKSLTAVTFTAEQKGGASGKADSTGVVLTFSSPVTSLDFGDIEIADGTGAVVTDILVGNGTTWTITLTSVTTEGTITVRVDHFGDFFVETNMLAIDVYKANLYNLDVIPAEGGSITGASSGKYLEGTQIEVEANPNPGYKFDSWEVLPSGALGSTALDPETLSFDMPASSLSIKPVFNRDNPEITGDFGIIFNSSTGEMFWDEDATGDLATNTNLFTIGEGAEWSGIPGTLTLSGFSWSTTAPTALTIVGNTTIYLEDENLTNTFESTSGNSIARGIRAYSRITIDGEGALTARGVNGIDLGSKSAAQWGSLVILGGTLTAQGSATAVRLLTSDNDHAGPANDADHPYSWAYSGSFDGDDATSGTSLIPFEFFETDHFVRFRALTLIYLEDAVQTGGISRTRDSAGIVFTLSATVTSLLAGEENISAGHVVLRNGTGAVVKGSQLADADPIFTINLSRVDAEGVVTIEVKPFGNFFVRGSLEVEVYKAVYTSLPADVEDPDEEDEEDEDDGADIPGGGHPMFAPEHFAYMIGYPDGTIGPERMITRAEVATVFFRILSDDVLRANWTHQNHFPDVNEGDWFNDAISVMDRMGKLFGYPDGTFKPGRTITRAELAAIAARFAREIGMLPHNDISFSDVAGHWGEDDIMYVAEIGWMNGYPDGSFMPNQELTRAEFMSMINRMLERVPEFGDDLLTDEMIVWADNANPGAWYYLAVQEATNSHVPAFKDSIARGLLFRYEYWVEMLENRDWSQFERYTE